MLEGGLITLTTISNSEDVLKLLPVNNDIDNLCLVGLNIRNLSAKPAWSLALMSKEPIVEYCLNLLHQRFLICKESFFSFISKSLTDTDLEYWNKIDKRIVEISTKFSKDKSKVSLLAVLETLSGIIYQMTIENHVKRELSQTVQNENAISLGEYINRITGSIGTKRVITCARNSQIELLLYALQKSCFDKNRPLFFIDSPDKLVTSSEFIKVDGSRGVLTRPPGGEICKFIESNMSNRPVFIVDLSRFKASDIVKYNRFFEKDADADGIPLPSESVIIGLRKKGDYNAQICYLVLISMMSVLIPKMILLNYVVNHVVAEVRSRC